MTTEEPMRTQALEIVRAVTNALRTPDRDGSSEACVVTAVTELFIDLRIQTATFLNFVFAIDSHEALADVSALLDGGDVREAWLAALGGRASDCPLVMPPGLPAPPCWLRERCVANSFVAHLMKTPYAATLRERLQNASKEIWRAVLNVTEAESIDRYCVSTPVRLTSDQDLAGIASVLWTPPRAPASSGSAASDTDCLADARDLFASVTSELFL